MSDSGKRLAALEQDEITTENVPRYSKHGKQVYAIGFFGVVRLDLSKKDEVETVVKQAREFAEMLERVTGVKP